MSTGKQYLKATATLSFVIFFQGTAVKRILFTIIHILPGELTEFDFAGKKMSYVDRSTGEIVECPVLVFTLPYSSFSYIEPLASSRLEHLVPAMNRAVEYFGGRLK